MQFKSSFVLAVLMAMQAVVFAQPITFGLPGLVFHPAQLKTTTTTIKTFNFFHKKFILSIGGRTFVEDIYNSIVRTIISRKTEVVPAHLSMAPVRRIGFKRDDIEERSYWEANEDELERRDVDDEPMELAAREFSKRRLNTREFSCMRIGIMLISSSANDNSAVLLVFIKTYRVLRSEMVLKGIC
ncbi:hypothetical protein F5887DRAFT_1162544 [Amanita rubescens]|nr:hypothetical protein F5887DRAFT_1165383 [Amanita rubescens]KAF8332150.1 hypothetical protein F5887DRAFT_1162544 [Amanita rubescens]